MRRDEEGKREGECGGYISVKIIFYKEERENEIF